MVAPAVQSSSSRLESATENAYKGTRGSRKAESTTAFAARTCIVPDPPNTGPVISRRDPTPVRCLNSTIYIAHKLDCNCNIRGALETQRAAEAPFSRHCAVGGYTVHDALFPPGGCGKACPVLNYVP